MSKNSVYSGQLDARITIIENVRATSGTGGKTDTPAPLGEFWAKVEDVSGNEEEEGKIIALNVRRYIIRHNLTIVSKKITDLTIDHGGEIYNIHSSQHLGRKEYIVLKCSKKE